MKKQILRGAILAILCVLPAAAQFTTVNGTVTDPNGIAYSSGTITALLVSSSSPVFSATKLPYTPPTSPVGLSSSGAFVMQLADVTALSPGGSTYNFTVCSGAGTVQPSIGKGPVCFTVTGITISGSSQDIGPTLRAAAPVLTSTIGGSGNMQTNAPNTMGAAGTIDMSSTSVTGGFTLPKGPGAAPTAAGVFSYDSTANQPVAGNGSSTEKLIPLIGSLPTSGNCGKFSVTGTQVGVQDAGFPCVAPSSVPTQVVQNGLLAEYRILSTETPGALVDYSGNGNNATGTVGTSPTILAGTGGLNFTGAGAVSLPTALNAGVTFQFVLGFQFTGAGYQGLITGNPSAAPATCSTFMLDNQHNNVNVGTNYHFEGWASNFGPTWRYTLQGSAVVTFEINATGDLLSINNQTLQSPQGGTTIGTLSAGNFQLGGAAGGGGNCISPSHYFTGQIYYVVVYNRQLTQAEVNSNNEFLQNTLAARGVPLSILSTSTTDTWIIDGDSEPSFVPNSMMNIPATINIYNLSASGYLLEQLVSDAPNTVDTYYQTAANREAVLMWGGTNDEAGSATTTLNYLNGYCRARHLRGFKCGIMSMMDRTSADSFKNNYNTGIRTSWPLFADFFVDIGEDPNLGCDGCSANSTYMSSGLHPQPGSANNIVAQFMQRGFNRAYGNLNWTTATTYTTGAPAATAITAASESTNTVTITSTLNPPVGSCVVISGVTPAGYNNVSGECWNVLTTSATNFTYYNWTTGLGNGTVFGTASVPLQKDADVYTILAGSATSPSFTLEPCGGYTGQNLYLKNENTTSPWVLTPFASETIDGASSLTMPTASNGNFPVIVLQSQLISTNTGGCKWVRLQ